MIDNRFDHLTRGVACLRLATGGSPLAAGAGMALLSFGRRGTRESSAQEGDANDSGWGFGPGESCVSDGQCDNSFPELGLLVCADNGYVYGPYGGELHCCRYARGNVRAGRSSDAHNVCCGDSLCLGGICGRA